MRPDQSNVKACLEALAEALPGRIGVGEAVRRQHGNALTLIANEPPAFIIEINVDVGQHHDAFRQPRNDLHHLARR